MCKNPKLWVGGQEKSTSLKEIILIFLINVIFFNKYLSHELASSEHLEVCTE